MKHENLSELINAIRSFDVSNEFIQGTLFLLGGTLLRSDPDTAQATIESALQWVVPHDSSQIDDTILGRLFDGVIYKLLEEYFFKLDVEIPTREIIVGPVSTRAC